MAAPNIAGVTISPNPPVPGQLVTFKVVADDADLGTARTLNLVAQDPATGEVLTGTLSGKPEDLKYDLVPADPTSPDPVQDSADETLFGLICPTGVTKLAYIAVVTDEQQNSTPYPFETLPIVVVPPDPNPDPGPRTLLWEAKLEPDVTGNLAPYTGTASGDPNGSQFVHVIDGPPESGFTGKVMDAWYKGTKDDNVSMSYRPKTADGLTNGDLLIHDLLLCVPVPNNLPLAPGEVPAPNVLHSWSSSGRKLVYFQPKGNGENHFVHSLLYGSNGTVQTTFSTRTLPTAENPKGKLQRLNVGGFVFGKPQRILIKLTPSSAPDVEDGEYEMWVGDPADWANARHGKLTGLRYIVANANGVVIPVTDFRVGQQVNENDTAKVYSENRWIKGSLLQLWR